MITNPIKPRICTTLEGTLPSSFSELEDKIFYKEIHTDYGDQVWIPRSSINEADEETQKLESFKYIKSTFDHYSEFDSITLNK